MPKISPYTTASTAELKKRFTEKKTQIQNKIDAIENEQLQHLSYLLKSYDDVISTLCDQLNVSKKQLVNDALSANGHMLDKGYQSALVKQVKGLIEGICSRKIPAPRVKAILAPAGEDLCPSKVVLTDLLFAFNIIRGHAEDLGSSTGSMTKARLQKKHISAVNRQNTQGKVRSETSLRIKAAVTFLKNETAAHGKDYVHSRAYKHLAIDFRNEHEPDFNWLDDNRYIVAIKHGLKELGMERAKRPGRKKN